MARWLSTASAVAFVRSLTLPKAFIGGAPFGPAPSLQDLLASGADGGASGLPDDDPAATSPLAPGPSAVPACCLPFACSAAGFCTKAGGAVRSAAGAPRPPEPPAGSALSIPLDPPVPL